MAKEKKERTYGTSAPFIIVAMLLWKVIKSLPLVLVYYVIRAVTFGRYPKE